MNPGIQLLQTADADPAIEMLRKDCFWLGCRLHLAGERKAGLKLLRTVQATFATKKERELFQATIDSIAGNELEYAAAAGAHSEIVQIEVLPKAS